MDGCRHTRGNRRRAAANLVRSGNRFLFVLLAFCDTGTANGVFWTTYLFLNCCPAAT
jgi:hypothetical protein